MLGLIWAQARNGVIGKDGAMPWHLPHDLAHFKAVTHGCPVIMGRKTWDALPPRFRPLPGRRNIVITRQPAWQGQGAERAEGLAQALALCEGAAQTWIIGGAQIYAQALPLAQRVEMTLIDADVEGDAFAPSLGHAWRETARSSYVSDAGMGYAFITWQRKSGG